jgi:alpha-amylase/alpha-mannosidase (GH57 family)
MPAKHVLHLVLLWHMHQPDYRDLATGEVLEPWTYLHALKDYTDMAAHLERHPRVRVVVNFTPVLLDQLESLAAELAASTPSEPLARLLLVPDLASAPMADKRWLLERGFRCHFPTMLTPFPAYVALRRIRESFGTNLDEAARYLGAQYFADLITWHHLAWTGETIRREFTVVRDLMAKGAQFTFADRRALYGVITAAVQGIVPRYRRLAERGQIELSTTPYAHPLAPLLFEFGAARETLDDAPLPDAPAYPDGARRASVHIGKALVRHAHHFGQRPGGMWPAEGALSDATLGALQAAGVRWTMSGEAVLANSLRINGHPPVARESRLSRAYRFDAAPELAVFFRDDELSDLIGFDYAHWHGREAASDFIARLERRREAIAATDGQALAVVALDGENAWEHYPYNGYYFFEELYGMLATHPSIRTTTASDYLDDSASAPQPLRHLVAGSWVHGTLSTWIGDPAKNAAWDRLCRAKRVHDECAATADWDEPTRRRVEAQLLLAESSDWFWWLGEGEDGQGTRAFDDLGRRNLANLYRLMGREPPGDLTIPARRDTAPDTGAAAIGTMRRAH